LSELPVYSAWYPPHDQARDDRGLQHTDTDHPSDKIGFGFRDLYFQLGFHDRQILFCGESVVGFRDLYFEFSLD
jgi:hypothetical protein